MLTQGSFAHLRGLCKQVFISIAPELEMDPVDRASAGSGLARRIGSNSVLTLESTGRKMQLAVPEAHQIFTAQGYFQLLSERVELGQVEMHFVSKRRLKTSQALFADS